MTRYTKQMFQRVGSAPRTKRGHSPIISWKGTTLTITCQCGERIQRATGCNRSGMDYAISYGKTAYESHIAKLN